ncbi:hypothetical protein Hanom_Chr13g01190701 [Helianthus anomalus]
MSMPVINLEGFQLEELDSYYSPVQVKQEANPKPAVTSNPTSSKTATVPKPSTTSKPCGSSSRKRKEPNSPAISDVVPFENHGFSESSKFMTDFLNQGLERLVFLYEDISGLNKMLETKLKKAETTVVDQAAIAVTKSQHYEDKYKEMIHEHHAALKKVTQEAKAKYDAAQAQHEHDMVSYRESLNGSVVISLLQARLKMAYEAKDLGFECPSWNVEAWLRELGGNLMEHPAKPIVEEPAKVADAGG